jgi:short-subunit dehydrogenase involved in D-alanine esterification of teichoic acids
MAEKFSTPKATFIMSLKYNKVLVIGATSGIGLAYAERVVQDGKKAIIVGRRKENLDSFVQKHGQDKAEAVEFDITKLDQIPKFAEDITSRHPDLDCVLLNSGIQRGFDFTKPESVDLSLIEQEFTTNYLSYIHLTTAFLPHLQKQENETSLVYVSSGLALVPIVTKRLNYEIFPPAVQTELHDEKHQPDIKNGRQMGMPLDQFTEESWAGLVKGDDQIPVGMAKDAFESFEKIRQEKFHAGVRFMKQQEQK